LVAVELTPEREYLIVTEFLEGAKEISEAEVDETVIDEGLAIVRRLWDAGLAHRDIKPANLLVQDGHVRLIDTFLIEVHPSPWRQAVDLANMMLVLALRSDPARVYQRARRWFTEQEIGEAFAARQGLAMPSQLRQLLAQRPDLREEFPRLLPIRPRPIAIQRWSVRRAALLLLALLALVPAVLMAVAFARASANPGGAEAVSGSSGSCTQIEALWLEAQSVPSASLIPCIQAFPEGIDGTLGVRDGESVLELSRASVILKVDTGYEPQTSAEEGAVTVRFAAACDLRTAGGGQAVAPGVRRFQTGGPGGLPAAADLFPGGCLTYQLDPYSSAPAALLDEVERAVTYRTRDDLRAALLRRSGGRLHLDPEGT
jgi:hypothetical protein